MNTTNLSGVFKLNNSRSEQRFIGYLTAENIAKNMKYHNGIFSQ